MSQLDKALRALGLLLSMWIVIWLSAFGIAWITEASQHVVARGGVWLVLPGILSFGAFVVALFSYVEG